MITLNLVGKKKVIFSSLICIITFSAFCGSIFLCMMLFAPDVGGPIQYMLVLTRISNSEMNTNSVVNLTASDFDSVPFLYTMVLKLISNDSKNESWKDVTYTEFETLEAFADHWNWDDFPNYFFFSEKLFKLSYFTYTA